MFGLKREFKLRIMGFCEAFRSSNTKINFAFCASNCVFHLQPSSVRRWVYFDMICLGQWSYLLKLWLLITWYAFKDFGFLVTCSISSSSSLAWSSAGQPLMKSVEVAIKNFKSGSFPPRTWYKILLFMAPRLKRSNAICKYHFWARKSVQ